MATRFFIPLVLTLATTLSGFCSNLQWEKVTPFLSSWRYPGFEFEPSIVRYGGGAVVAMGSTILAYSLDNGVTWRQAKGFETNAPFTGLYFVRLIYGGNQFVAASSSGKVSISADGVNWKVAT